MTEKLNDAETNRILDELYEYACIDKDEYVSSMEVMNEEDYNEAAKSLQKIVSLVRIRRLYLEEDNGTQYMVYRLLKPRETSGEALETVRLNVENMETRKVVKAHKGKNNDYETAINMLSDVLNEDLSRWFSKDSSNLLRVFSFFFGVQ